MNTKNRPFHVDLIPMPLNYPGASVLPNQIFVAPYFGNGWHNEQKGGPPLSQLLRHGPPSFIILHPTPVFLENEIVGLFGKVDSVGHDYFGYQCVALLRLRGNYNFTDRPGECMVWLCAEPPVIAPAKSIAIYEYITPNRHKPCIQGYGDVAESSVWVETRLRRAEKTRMEIQKQGGA